MKQLIEEKFPLAIEKLCIQTVSFPEFEVIDQPNGKCEVFEGISDEAHLRVKNENLKEINFLAIDKCLFFDNREDPRRCDCALFDDKRICFVEIKNVGSGKRREKRKKAIEQLKHSILEFKNKGILFQKIDALVCFASYQTYPKRVNLDRELQFMEDCGASLYEGNEEVF